MLGPLGKRKKAEEEDADIDVVPVMNVFLVIVLLLLISFSFFNLRAINTSVPVLGNTASNKAQENPVKITVVVELDAKGINLSALSDEVDPQVLAGMGSSLPKDSASGYPLEKLSTSLSKIKQQYPRSDTVIIIPENSVIYDTIIQAMDVARFSKDGQLFPNVVISGKVG